jgi:hypothetical protein
VFQLTDDVSFGRFAGYNIITLCKLIIVIFSLLSPFI